MVYINNNSLPFEIMWTIYKGKSSIKEDFCRAHLKVFAVCCDLGYNAHKHSKYYLEHSINEDGDISVMVPVRRLPEGVYSLKAIWFKNKLSGHPHHEPCVLDRSISIVPNVICISSSDHGTTPFHGDYPVVKIQSDISAFGYDGMDAYEMAVFKGATGDEDQWLEAYKGDLAKLQEAEDKAEQMVQGLENIVITATDEVLDSETDDYFDPKSVKVVPQMLDAEERETARNNIHALSREEGLIADDEEWTQVAVDPSIVTGAVRHDVEQFIDPVGQYTARTNINAASKDDFDNANEHLENIYDKIKDMKFNDSFLVGDWVDMNQELKDKVPVVDPTLEEPFVVRTMNVLDNNIGVIENIDTDLTSTNTVDAINEVYALTPDEEDSNINMETEVFV